MTRLRTPAALALLVACAAAIDSAPSTAAGTKTITVKDNVFSPKKTTIARNTLVTWRWAPGSSMHDVKSRGTKRFRSSELKDSGVHRYRFKKAGTYKYICTIHVDQGMTGTIIVR